MNAANKPDLQINLGAKNLIKNVKSEQQEKEGNSIFSMNHPGFSISRMFEIPESFKQDNNSNTQERQNEKDYLDSINILGKRRAERLAESQNL